MSAEEHDDTDTTASDVDTQVKTAEAAKPEASAPTAQQEREVQPASGKRKPSPAGQAVSGADVDTVSLTNIVYKNRFSRKSLSVHHVQRRLAELGYPDAYTDKDGWYGDLTQAAVDAYRRDNKLGEGAVDAEFLAHLFADDPNVTVE